MLPTVELILGLSTPVQCKGWSSFAKPTSKGYLMYIEESIRHNQYKHCELLEIPMFRALDVDIIALSSIVIPPLTLHVVYLSKKLSVSTISRSYTVVKSSNMRVLHGYI